MELGHCKLRLQFPLLSGGSKSAKPSEERRLERAEAQADVNRLAAEPRMLSKCGQVVLPLGALVSSRVLKADNEPGRLHGPR